MNKPKKIKFFFDDNDSSNVYDENGKKYPWVKGFVDARTREVIKAEFVNPDDVDVSHWKSIQHLKEKVKWDG